MKKQFLLSFFITSFIGAGLCHASGHTSDLVEEEKTPICNTMSKLSDDGYFVFEETEVGVIIRDKLSEYTTRHCPIKFFQEFPEIQMLRDDFFGVCDDYAFTKIFKPYIGDDFIRPLNRRVEEFFTVTTEPQEGDLVCYYYSPSCSKISHYGVVCGPNLVESKWGYCPVFKHPPFHISKNFGNFIRYYRLKTEKSDLERLEKLENKPLAWYTEEEWRELLTEKKLRSL